MGHSAGKGSRELSSDSGLHNGGGGGDDGGGDDQFAGGLLVASVSECDSSAFGEDPNAFRGAESDMEEVEYSDDSDDSDEAEDDSNARAEQRRSSVYDERMKRPRSAASLQYTALADKVASDVALGGSPAQSNIIQRMTIVSFPPHFLCFV